MDVCVLGCTPGHIPRYMGQTSIIIKDANYGSVVRFVEFASIRFHIGFPVLWYYTCSHPILPLVFHFSSLMFLSYHTMSTSCLICSRHGFSMHIYDLDLLILMCLSMLATWLSHHHSPGEFWLLWILMSRSRSLDWRGFFLLRTKLISAERTDQL